MKRTTTEELIRNSWNQSWNNVVLLNNDLLRNKIIWMYSNPERKYHGFNHLLDCLTVLQKYRSMCKYASLVELALWLHDVVYDIQSSTNEYDSFKYFRKQIREAKTLRSKTFIDFIESYIEELIRATLHFDLDDKNLSIDQKIICDIDIYSLGSKKKKFKNYCNLMRKEYHIYDDVTYCTGRIALFNKFIDRGFVYRTDVFRDKYEEFAMVNIHNEINRLENILNGTKEKVLDSHDD